MMKTFIKAIKRPSGRVVEVEYTLPEIKKTRVVIPHENILTLPSSPVEIVAAPKSGSAIFPLGAFLVCDTTAATYTVDLDALLGLDYDGSFSAYSLINIIQNGLGDGVSSLLASGGLATAIMGIQAVFDGNATGSTYTGAASPAQSPSGYDGLPLLLAASNNGDDFSDGDPANSLAITVFYSIINILAT